MGNKWKKAVAYMGILSVLLTGCGKGTQPIEGIESYVTEVSDIAIPEDVRIIGLGEATHGNVELQNLKKEVFQVLVENKECRIFALEADFGGGYKVNEYIHGGDGTAEEAVAELGFGLYRTDEMEDFVEWLRTYNDTAAENEKLSFYGFDMQRYDNNKEILFEYLAKVDEESKQELEAKLQSLTDDTVYTQTKDVNTQAAEDMSVFLAKMEENRADYIAKSAEKSYQIAYLCAECIMQNATIQSGSVTYNVARDQYMADKVTDIMDMEQGERVMISGHNGHIQKKSPNVTYTCMGELLSGEYGEAYYTIGTDFIEGKVNVISGSGNETNIKITAENALKAQVQNLDGNVFYVDVAAAKENAELSEILDSPLRMVSIGNEFSGWQKLLKSFYTTEGVLSDNYDGIIILKTVTPTVRKPVPDNK